MTTVAAHSRYEKLRFYWAIKLGKTLSAHSQFDTGTLGQSPKRSPIALIESSAHLCLKDIKTRPTWRKSTKPTLYLSLWLPPHQRTSPRRQQCRCAPSPELEVSILYTNLELTTPSPVLGDVDYTQDQEESPTHMSKELISTLKIAQEKPKPRPRPQYHGFYRMPLPGDEDGDVSTVLEYGSEESDQFVVTGDHDVE